jgi:glycosyltransferase involved in cell wall biosynthesis
VRDARKRYDVAFYVPWLGPLLAQDHGLSTGGAETQVFLLSRALARRGMNVCLLVFEIPGVDIPSTVEGVDVVLRPPYKSHQGILGNVRETVKMRAALASVQADVIVTRAAGPHVGLIRLFALRRKFVYSSASPHDFDFVRVAPKPRDRVLLSFGMRLADEIVVQTEEQVRSCRQRLGRVPVLIRSLCELPEQDPAEPEAFLWVGRYQAYKRPLEYIELAKAVPEARFWMVMSTATVTRDASQLQRDVEAAAAALPNLELFRNLPRPDLMQLVRRAVAMVSTSEFEGMSNVLLEGWARSVPALVFSYDSDAIVTRHGLGYVAEGSREGLGQAARELWVGRWDRRDLSRRCRDYVEAHHAPERIAEQWAATLVTAPALEARDSVAAEAA